MVVLLSVNKDYYYIPSVDGWSLILSNEYIILPALMAMVVPTVVGVMVFRFLHSKKTSVFIHSLPVKREANFVSSVLASLTLMALPVILNTLVLIILSLSGYGAYFTAGECIIWMLINLFTQFVMFSAVCFVASLTGNSFAMIALNILFHFFVLIFAGGFSIISEAFLYGFANENELINKVFEHTFPTKIMSEVTTWSHGGFESRLFVIEFIVIAIVLYTLAGIFYKKRRMETAEDVAGFKCLNHIFKYMVTFIGAIAAFCLFCRSITENQLIFWFIIALVSMVIYFASEMILKKTFRVWNSYKGFLGFLAAFLVMICIFAFTGFFGFENYIPLENEVEKVALYDYYREEKPYIENADVIKKARIIHADTLNFRDEIIKKDKETYFHIEYVLKNGKTIHRRYGTDEDRFFEIMDSMYKSDVYKRKNEDIFSDMESVYSMHIYCDGESTEISAENKNELIDCIKKDIETLSYGQIESLGWGFTIDIEYIKAKETSAQVLLSDKTYPEESGKEIHYMNYNINPNYKNTISWIKENGYWDSLNIKNDGIIYICKDYNNLPFVDKDGGIVEIETEKDGNIIKIQDEAMCQKLIEYILSSPSDYIKKNDRYYVYQVRDAEKRDYRRISVITKEELGILEKKG